MKRSKRQSRLLELIMILLIVLLLISFVSPTKELVAQWSRMSILNEQLSTQRTKTTNLRMQVNNLNDPDYIAQLARDQFGLVKPGERSYVITGAPKQPLPSAVYPERQNEKRTLWQKIKNSLNDLLDW